ncbi:hypothetical protein TIFTF001_010214 [Ficus carica]|uniref:Uncharacterized protein n=1 Tax=Ficus carica TaxID=3494 RepID=A0AA88ABU4_FICCA|nr:hypothetical protein TIFTF001_010214 [Ficus carica]
MEAIALLTLMFSILFLPFTTNGVSARHGISIIDQPPAVLDSSGNILLKGEYYYLKPAIPLFRLYTAAIVPGVYRNNTCWLQLAIEVFTYGITGVPVKFSPVEPTEDESIRESTDLNIKFSEELSSICGGTSVLKVGAIGDEFLSLGGAEEDRISWFKIEKASEISNNVYKLVSSSDPQVGRDVGNSTRFDGTKRLVLSDVALPFSFEPLRNGPSASK